MSLIIKITISIFVVIFFIIIFLTIWQIVIPLNYTNSMFLAMFSNNQLPDKIKLDDIESKIERLANIKGLNIEYINRGISRYYYLQAFYYLDLLDNQTSTENLVRAIEFDPLPMSEDYIFFRSYRNEFLEQGDNREKFFNE